MAKNNNYGISNQISKYQTGKKLLEFISKLVPAEKEHYAALHSSESGAKSCVGMTLLDYSRGTGQNTVSVSVNLSPAQLEWWYTAVMQRHIGFKMEQEKILSFKADANGTAPVTKMVVSRNATDNKGQPTRYPWYVSVENGTGRVQRNANGGTSIAPQSYRKESQVFVNLNDEDMFRVLYAVHNFVSVWETTFGPDVIRAGVEAARAQSQNKQSAQQPAYQQPTQPMSGYVPPAAAPQTQGYVQPAYQQPAPQIPGPGGYIPGYNPPA